MVCACVSCSVTEFRHDSWLHVLTKLRVVHQALLLECACLSDVLILTSLEFRAELLDVHAEGGMLKNTLPDSQIIA